MDVRSHADRDSSPLNLQDATFLHAETSEYPTHIAGLQIFRMPQRDDDFVVRLVDRLLEVPPAAFWRRRLAGSALTPRWDVLDAADVDLDFHVRRIALPQPGSQAQLERVVERLHARRLDRDRPLWEIYYIEGLAGDRFAVYSKTHHALLDGVAGVMLAMAAVSKDPDADPIAPWSVDLPAAPAAAKPPLRERLGSVSKTLVDLQRANLQQSVDWAGRWLGAHERSDLPFAAPRTAFNGRVDRHRRFATRSLPMDRVKAVAKATGATLNDLVLAMLGGALRRWLEEQQQLPDRSLVASCPVSVRAGDGVGNNLSALLADLASDEADPLARLKRVMDSTARGKRSVAAMSAGAAQSWATMLGLAGLVPALVNQGRTLRPLANLVVSNVPGPREPRYLGGCEMVGYYPVSIVTHGQGLNITLLSRAGAVDFGFTACRESVRDLGRLGDALEATLAEYESAVAADLERRRSALASLLGSGSGSGSGSGRGSASESAPSSGAGADHGAASNDSRVA